MDPLQPYLILLVFGKKAVSGFCELVARISVVRLIILVKHVFLEVTFMTLQHFGAWMLILCLNANCV